MKKTTFTLLIFLMTISAYCQTKENKFNFDFEQIENGIPIGWTKSYSENYTVSLDSINVKKGKYSILIEFKEGEIDNKSFDFTIPDNYTGKKVTLSGYIKTENVSDGYAGLWMMIDQGVWFDNMSNRGIKGTTDWKKYEISLNLKPFEKNKIAFGGFLVGKGKMWLDNLTVTIDEKNIEELKPIVFGAENDKEFDNGSGVSNIILNNKNIENLKILGLTWGFLKYYHPNIAKGEVNWDYELFRILPNYLKVQNEKERDAILVNWIHNLGSFEPENIVETDTLEIKMKPDLGWINNSNLSSDLTELLLKVKNSKRTGRNFYVSLFPIVGNPVFNNENPYASMKFPDEGFRVLSLFRYWNIIQYYFPYRYLIGEDWKNVLQEFIPKFIKTKNEEDYTLTVLELIARIHDSHAGVWGSNQILNKYQGTNYAAPHIIFIKNKAVVDYFHNEELGKETGLKLGDEISKVNNQTIESIVQNKLKLTSASNFPTQLREIGRDLLRTNDSTINVELIRDNVKLNKILKTYSIKEIDLWSKFRAKDTCFKLISPTIGYINNNSIKAEHLPKIWKLIKETKGLIIDNRYSPMYDHLDSLSSYLYPKNKTYAKLTIGSITTPGLFTFVHFDKTGKENTDYYKGKVVVLVNDLTQSAGEYHTMAYSQSPNSRVIGSQSAGADGNMSIFYLPGGIKSGISGQGVNYPDGRETQRIGIVPDIEVRPTIEGIKNGRDELIEKAIEVINNH